jgi:predicted anti-sigma-YlaC factor YlaD
MSGDTSPVSCAEFQSQLPELISSGADLANHPHLSNCPLCRALLADLEAIAEAARQLLRPVEPPDELWDHIASAIRHEDDSRG